MQPFDTDVENSMISVFVCLRVCVCVCVRVHVCACQTHSRLLNTATTCAKMAELMVMQS